MAETIERRKCAHCDELLPVDAHILRKFCSKRCKDRAFRAKNRVRIEDCQFCGERLPKGAPAHRLYCDRRCKNRAEAKRRREKYAVDLEFREHVKELNRQSHWRNKETRNLSSRLYYARHQKRLTFLKRSRTRMLKEWKAHKEREARLEALRNGKH